MYRAEFEIRGGTWAQGLFDTVEEARAWLAKSDD
jgi:hypothetical protein